MDYRRVCLSEYMGCGVGTVLVEFWFLLVVEIGFKFFGGLVFVVCFVFLFV